MSTCWLFFNADLVVGVEISSPHGQPWGHPGELRVELSPSFSDVELVTAIRRVWAASHQESDLDTEEKRLEAFRCVGDRFGVERDGEPGWGRLFDEVKYVTVTCVDKPDLKAIAVTATKPVKGGGGRTYKKPKFRLGLDASDEEIADAVREAMQYTW